MSAPRRVVPALLILAALLLLTFPIAMAEDCAHENREWVTESAAVNMRIAVGELVPTEEQLALLQSGSVCTPVNNSFHHRTRYAANAWRCLDCGAYFGLEVVVTFDGDERHFYDENNLCADCGHTLTCANHNGSGETTQRWLDDAVFTPIDDALHLAEGTLRYEFHCTDCGEVYDFYDAAASSLEEAHVFEDGVCVFCGMEDPVKPTSGECGDGLTWSLDDDGTLTIRGEGAVWEGAFRNDTRIRRLVLEPGVETLGQWAFEGCSALERVDVPLSLAMVEVGAFEGCDALTDLCFDGAEIDKVITVHMGNTAFQTQTWHYAETLAPAVRSGICGSSVRWMVDEDGVLTIGGRGRMDDYQMSGGLRPDFGSFDRVVVRGGVKYIGQNLFAGGGRMDVVLMEGVEEIGSYAF